MPRLYSIRRVARTYFAFAFSSCLVFSSACNRAEPNVESGSKDKPGSVPLLADTGASPAEGNSGSLELHDNSTLRTSAAAGGANTLVLPPRGAAGDHVERPSELGGGGDLGASRNSSKLEGDSDASQPARPGVQIEMSAPSFPSTGLDATSTLAESKASQQLSDRAFMQLTLPVSADAAELLSFFNQCDRAVQDLAITKRAEQLNEAEFHEQAKRLSSLKLAAAEQLLALNDLSAVQLKAGTAAQVESLSHLTSLGDVQAAQKLQSLAEKLTRSDDAQLAHQGKLVLLGFRLNQLQEGQLKDPNELLQDIDQLMTRPEDRSLVELMALQRCAEVLSQLAYKEQSQQVLDRIVRAYRSSPDIDLSMRAWSIETEGAPTLIAFHEALQSTFEGKSTDPERVARAAHDLLQTFPGINTMLHVSRFMIPLEFSGNVSATSELAKVVADARRLSPASPLVAEIDVFLDCHLRRLSSVGKPIELTELATFDGKPFEWSSYRGKVVLLCFWASWEINSLEEMRRLKQLRQAIPDADFEIVAINLDDSNMSSAEQMVQRQAYPWSNVRSSNPTAVGFATPAAKILGVNAVPFLLLVDPQGRVTDIHVRGEKATERIRAQLERK